MAIQKQTHGRSRPAGPGYLTGRRRAIQVLGAVALLLGLAGIVATGAAQAGKASAAGGRTWKIERTRNPASADISALSSVACPSKRACTAVGSSAHTLSSSTLPLAEHWNGRQWRIQSIPAPKRTSDTLYGISCPSARWCVAVGDAFHTVSHRDAPLTEIWNGRRWRVRPTPASKTPASLYAVSCTSKSSCMAVGFTLNGSQRAIAEHWNGRTWRAQGLARPNKNTRLVGVSCPRAHACTAVGYQSNGNTQPLAESWNGKRWRAQTVPVPAPATVGLLDAVSCTSPSACTATGTQLQPETTLAERWNGKSWRVQPTPNPADYTLSVGGMALDGVSCTSATACTASGQYSPHGTAAYFVEFWNGQTWRLETVPHPADFQRGALLGVSCVPARCVAVGAYGGATRLQVTLGLTT